MTLPGPARRRAFGLEIVSDIEAPGLVRATTPPRRPTTSIGLVDAGAFRELWPPSATLLTSERYSGDPRPRTIAHHPEAGWLFDAPGYGLARVDPSGTDILCAPDPDMDWRWQRFLIGRVLPHAAVLQGLEPLHAASVSLEDGVIGIVGPTGAGKTSLAIRLMLGGASFMSDDIVALELEGAVPIAHPGAATVGIRPAEHDLLTPSERAQLGLPLGLSSKHDVVVTMGASAPGPLRALYVLEPASEGTPAIRPLERSPLPVLLGHTFVTLMDSPERLARQFTIAGAVAEHAGLWRLAITPGVGARELAEAIASHEIAR